MKSTLTIIVFGTVVLAVLGFTGSYVQGPVKHDSTLQGDGVDSPLGIAFPLKTISVKNPTTQNALEIQSNGAGISSHSNADGVGVLGSSKTSIGVAGYSISQDGVFGSSDTGAGVSGRSGNIGVYAENTTNPGPGNKAYLGARCCAGDFYGEVFVHGKLQVAGQKNFVIDNPLDPANKYLYHASVESSEMKNVYDGVIVLNGKGEALVELPEWFQALNKDFRYQLTAIGSPGPTLYIAQEIKNNRFTIAGGKSGMKVSWMVTGVRQDAWAKANPLSVQQDKPSGERGTYLYPELVGQPARKGIEQARYWGSVQQPIETTARREELSKP